MDLTQLLGDELKKQALSQITKQVGGDSKVAQALIVQALPTIIKGLEKNTQEKEGRKALDTALESHTGETKIDLEDGVKIMEHILGKKTDDKISKIAKETGATKEQSSQVMSMLSSLVIEKLGDQKKAGVSAKDITKMISEVSSSSSTMKMFDQDGDGDFDKQDVIKFGLAYMMKKLLGKK